MRRVLMKEIKM